jgi:hypothetical protein
VPVALIAWSNSQPISARREARPQYRVLDVTDMADVQAFADFRTATVRAH